MASKPRKWRSRELPPNMSDLINKILRDSDSFTKQLNRHEERMWLIVKEFLKISEQVKTVQQKKDHQRTVGVVSGVFGGVGAAALMLTGVGIAALPLLALSVAGGGTVIHANVTKLLGENECAKEVKRLGEEFIEMIEPMKQILVEIHQSSKDLEENVSKHQAERSLINVEEFQEVLQQVSKLKETSEGAVFKQDVLIQFINDMLVLIVHVFRVTATPEEDKKLGDAIVAAGDQSQKVTQELCRMRDEVSKFRERTGASTCLD